MDYTTEELEDLATMRILRTRLRAIADAKIAECEAMEAAKNWLDMNRQIKAIMSADRMVIALYSPPPLRRSSRRKPTSALSHTLNENGPDAGLQPSSPPHFPNGEVARRSRAPSPAKSVAEGYSAVETTSPSPTDATSETPATTLTWAPEPTVAAILEADPEFAAIAAGAAREATRRIDGITRRYARATGIWPDGAPFEETEANWQTHTLTATLPFSLDDDYNPEAWMRGEILNRANAIARAHGEKTGLGLDNRPYDAGAPDRWSLSANIGTGTDSPAPGEVRSPPSLPWWIVRKPPPS